MKVGDKIKVGKYTATCQKVEGCIATFCMDQYLDEAMEMNSDFYKFSELRKRINSDDILNLFSDIRDRMIPFENGDLVRIPYAEEMFDPEEITWINETNPEIEQWGPMKDRRNVMCFRKNKWSWGWLMNKVSVSTFAYVNGNGFSDYTSPWYLGGVRLVFQTKACEEYHFCVPIRTEESKIITISSSLTQESLVHKLIPMLKTLYPDATIYHPFMLSHKILPIQDKRAAYIKYIKESSTLAVLSKSDSEIVLGESVGWEVAIAEYFNVPVCYFLPGQCL